MAGNTLPIYTKVGQIQVGNAAQTAVNTAVDGTGSNVQTIFTADATNGSYIDHIRFKPAASAAATTATAARIYINDGGGTAAANNQFFDSVVLPSTTDSITTASNAIVFPIKLMLPPGYKVNWTIGTASANGWYALAVGGKY